MIEAVLVLAMFVGGASLALLVGSGLVFLIELLIDAPCWSEDGPRGRI